MFADLLQSKRAKGVLGFLENNELTLCDNNTLLEISERILFLEREKC